MIDQGKRIASRWLALGYAGVYLALFAVLDFPSEQVLSDDRVDNYWGRTLRYHLATDESPGARASLTFDTEGVHFSGGGFRDWGLSLSLSKPVLVYEHDCPIEQPHVHGLEPDGTELELVFSAKAPAAPQPVVLLTSAADRFVVPKFGRCSTCWDWFLTPISLTPDFREYRVRLSEMRQSGWGRPQRPNADPAELEEIALRLPAGLDFDFTFRDLRVVRATRHEPAPAPATASHVETSR